MADAHPYIVVAPNYTRTSAGIKAMHLLCHELNRHGQMAFVTSTITNPELLTPQVSLSLVRSLNDRGLNPIVVYPETILGNPIGGSCVVRYLLNFPGKLGGSSSFPSDEMSVSWAKGMNSSPDGEEFTLYIPTVDRKIFYPSPPDAVRSGTCFYWEKYKYIHRGLLEHKVPGSFEIRRSSKSILNPHQLADLFRRSEFFYCYENSMLSLEAMLCGCPVILVPNEHFDRVIGDLDMGMDGMAWGDSAEEIQHAKRTIVNVSETYDRMISQLSERLELFISRTQDFARSRAFKPIRYYEIEPMPIYRLLKIGIVVLLIGLLVVKGRWADFIAMGRRLFCSGFSGFNDELLKIYRHEKGHLKWILRM